MTGCLSGFLNWVWTSNFSLTFRSVIRKNKYSRTSLLYGHSLIRSLFCGPADLISILYILPPLIQSFHNLYNTKALYHYFEKYFWKLSIPFFSGRVRSIIKILNNISNSSTSMWCIKSLFFQFFSQLLQFYFYTLFTFLSLFMF